MSESTLLKTKQYWLTQKDSPNKQRELEKIERNLRAYAVAKEQKNKNSK